MAASKKLDQELYNDNVKFWDRAWSPVKAPYTQLPDLPYLEAIPLELRKNGVQTVLDLGCGSGWLSIFLGRAGFQVTGVDVAGHALDLAAQWAHQENLTLKFEVADITKLPFARQSFHACVANSIFEHLTYDLAVRCFDNLHKTLRPGGTLFACFDQVGTGPGEYYELEDGTHVYTDKGRTGMLLRNFDDAEIKRLLARWHIDSFETIESGSRIVWAHT